ncbi:PTPRJ phosphatase, partial [Polypterus senegalus]
MCTGRGRRLHMPRTALLIMMGNNNRDKIPNRPGRRDKCLKPGQPGPVTSPTVTNVTTTSIFLCWVAPLGGNVFYGVNFSNSGQAQQLVTNRTCINVTNLISATSYSFTVFAVAGDNTTVSDSATITAFTKPGPVPSPTVTSVTTTSIFLCWVAPLGGNVSYGVNFSNSGQAQQLVTNRTCINVTNLNSATSYSFTVFAVAGDNTTVSDSATITAFTKPGPVISPTVTNVTTTSIFLCWVAPLGGNVSYGVNFSNSGHTQQLLTNQTCINVTNLISATSYSFTIFAVAGDNTTISDSSTITAFTKPGPVTSPTVTNVTTTSIFLCWVAPLGGNVSYGVNFSNSGQTQQLVTNHTCINVTNLNSATSYSFTVFAVAGDNTTISDSVTITAFTSPGPVISPTVTSVTTSSIFLCWVSPLGGNVSYGVNFSISGQTEQLLTNQTCLNVTNLNSSTSYSFTVFAVAGDNTTISDSATITAFTNDESRVKLSVGHEGDPNDDYINASYLPLANGNKRRIKHFHFTAWPDHGVPENTDLLIRFRNLVREHIDQSQRNSPTVVHCSAGVGRTGTLIALDHVIHQIDRTNSVNVYKIVCDLRMHRPLMVQSENQYIFLNDCIMNVIRSKQNSNQFYKNNAAEAIYENITPARV